MRIGIFHVTLPAPDRKPGGVEMFADRLATALCRAGHEVEVISLTPPPPGHVYRHRAIFQDAAWLYRNRFCLLLILPLLLNFIDMGRYDVLHLHGNDWFYVNRRSASVRTLHGSAWEEARSAEGVLRRLSQYLIYPLEHLSRRLATCTLAVGAETAQRYRADGVAKLFSPAAIFFPGPKAATPTFVFIGTWRGRKRGRFVAGCFLERILPQMPSARLIMVCDHAPDSDAILHLNNPTDEQIGKAVRGAWALLCASTYEGFGLPYLEAMMSQTAIVTTRNAGADYVLQNGRYGLIVADDGFALAVLRLAQDGRLMAHYETLGLIRAAEFSESRVIAEHGRWYQWAAARRKEAHRVAV